MAEIGMKLSTDRILTSHVGSLPRSQEVVDFLFTQDRGEPYEQSAFDAAMQKGVEDVVAKQAQCGIDVVSDGETSKISYATYIRHRLTGFEGDSSRPTPQDLDDFPAFRDRLVAEGHSATYKRPVCKGPIAVKDMGPLTKDIARMKQALAKTTVTEGFMTAVSPGTIAVFQPNEYYPSHEKYMEALAEVMKSEYEAIAASGILVQLDCPDLAMGRHSRFKTLSREEFLRHAEIQVEALNHAVANIPADRIRLHICWGNYEGPHTHDIPLTDVLPLLFKAKPKALLIEGANPRHDHEWVTWKQVKLPDEKILIPGVIDTSTNFVEHPELVAQRIVRYANVIGRERIIAGTDCGLGTFAGFGPVHPDIAWAKLQTLAEGAAIASQQLFGAAATV
jgi:5-methyltetrahydropteroyltriglutamate--homocysteine methyltransferase